MMSAGNLAELIPSEMHLLGIMELYSTSWTGYLFSWIQLAWLPAAKSRTRNQLLPAYLQTNLKTCKQTQARSNKCQDSSMRNTPAEI